MVSGKTGVAEADIAGWLDDRSLSEFRAAFDQADYIIIIDDHQGHAVASRRGEPFRCTAVDYHTASIALAGLANLRIWR